MSSSHHHPEVTSPSPLPNDRSTRTMTLPSAWKEAIAPAARVSSTPFSDEWSDSSPSTRPGSLPTVLAHGTHTRTCSWFCTTSCSRRSLHTHTHTS